MHRQGTQSVKTRWSGTNPNPDELPKRPQLRSLTLIRWYHENRHRPAVVWEEKKKPNDGCRGLSCRERRVTTNHWLASELSTSSLFPRNHVTCSARALFSCLTEHTSTQRAPHTHTSANSTLLCVGGMHTYVNAQRSASNLCNHTHDRWKSNTNAPKYMCMLYNLNVHHYFTRLPDNIRHT